MLNGIIWLMLNAGLAHAGDELVRVSALPIVSGQRRAQSHSRLIAALPDGVLAVPLTPEQATVHTENSTCRLRPNCVTSHTPKEADLVLGLALRTQGEKVQYDLRFLRNGALINRRSQLVDNASLWRAIEQELAMVLQSWHSDALLYSMLENPQHRAKAKSALKKRFPKSPYTRAIQKD
jgi:hypothetical protein|tara:strand:- start:48 stop:584 length:537 start_codon:yes stop_codon:yes gene_type:complete